MSQGEPVAGAEVIVRLHESWTLGSFEEKESKVKMVIPY